MPTSRTIRTLASSLLLIFAFASAADATEVVRRGTLALGNDACDDTEPEVATQPDGTFLAVWQRCSPSQILAQRFDSIGRRLGSEIDLGTGLFPQVAALPDRGYAVAYLRQLMPDLETFGVFARRLGSTGLPLADAARIDEEGENSQVTPYAVPRLASAPDGRLFVAWHDLFSLPFPLPFPEMSALGRMLEADLTPQGSTFDLGPIDLFSDSDISLDEAGRAISVTILSGLVAWRFDESGAPIGNAINVGGGSLEVFNPRLAPRPGGGWWLVWNEGGAPQVSTRVFLRALDADGHTAGPRIDVGLLGSFETLPAVAVDPDGLVLVAARDRAGVLQQRLFDASGAPVSDLAPLAEPNPFAVGRAALAESSATGFVALWQGGAHLGPFPPTLTGWDLFGALLASSCPSPNAVCAGVGSALAEVQVRWRLGNLSGIGRGLRLGRHLLFTVENPGRFDVAVDLSGGAIDWAATTNAAVQLTWTEGGSTHSVVKPAGRFASGRLKIPTPPILATPGETAEVASEPAEALAVDGCAPSTRTACLFGGRFRVTAFVTGADGVERPAEVLAFADRQSILSFAGAGGATFSLVDGRAVNGKFWVHWGGLSTAAFRIEVTDISTGTTRTYANPAGKRQSQADRGAF
ncbi:MAG TPA: hypothetical protein VGS22_17655 [Thermoanaerobaculia bacterium]|jgi:hypothetical protein|nr:hypothetical protein [Thermoanaerobaculia bacterium]